MSKTIFKYPLSIIDRNVVTAPPMAILHVREQYGETPTVWAEVDESEPEVEHVFHIVGTGMTVPSDATYVGTAFTGAWVWHVYKENG